MLNHPQCMFWGVPLRPCHDPLDRSGEDLEDRLEHRSRLTAAHLSFLPSPHSPENESLDDTENTFKLSLIDQVEEKDKICLPQKAKHISYREFKVATCWGGIEGFPKSTASLEQPVTSDTPEECLQYCVGSPRARLTLFDL